MTGVPNFRLTATTRWRRDSSTGRIAAAVGINAVGVEVDELEVALARHVSRGLHVAHGLPSADSGSTLNGIPQGTLTTVLNVTPVPTRSPPLGRPGSAEDRVRSPCPPRMRVYVRCNSTVSTGMTRLGCGTGAERVRKPQSAGGRPLEWPTPPGNRTRCHDAGVRDIRRPGRPARRHGPPVRARWHAPPVGARWRSSTGRRTTAAGGCPVTTVAPMAGAVDGSTEWLVVTVAGLAGLFIGSFLNVVVYRAPLGLSVSTPRSFCPTCDRQLAWWENVPVVSWLALRGRCHTCHTPISLRYPLVEAATAVSFALVAWAWHGYALYRRLLRAGRHRLAVALIEYGGYPDAAVGGRDRAAGGQVLIVVAAVWLDHWTVPSGRSWAWSSAPRRSPCSGPGTRTAGTRGGTAGRCSPSPGAGWAGSPAGAGRLVAGVGAWILAEAACLLVLWARPARRPAAAGHGEPRPGSPRRSCRSRW